MTVYINDINITHSLEKAIKPAKKQTTPWTVTNFIGRQTIELEFTMVMVGGISDTPQKTVPLRGVDEQKKQAKLENRFTQPLTLQCQSVSFFYTNHTSYTTCPCMQGIDHG